MNILHGDIKDIAEKIKLKLLAKGPQCVYAKPTGIVSVYHSTDLRNEACSPENMVGTYNRKAKVAESEDDLMARRREISA